MESAGQLLLSAPPLQLASANMILPNSNNWQKQQEQNPILQQQQHIDRSMDQIIIDVDGSTNSQDEFTITEDASDVKVVAGVGGEQASSADTNVLNQEQRKCPARLSPARLTTENQQEKSIKCEQEMDEEMDEAKVGQNPVMVETSGSQSDANQPQNAASIGASGKPLPVIKPPGDEKEDRPTLSYKDLIIEAIESSAECRLKLSEIYQVIKYLHPYYQRRSDQWGWQNSIRHNLSLHDCFVKLPLKQTSANGVVGHFWTVIHRSPEDKQGPTRRRSRANGGGTTGKGKKAMALAQQQHQDQRDAKEGKRGIKGRHTQSVCSDSGFVSDGFDGEFDASQEITMRERLGSASAPPRPRPVLLTASTGDHQKFQSLQSPLALKGLHFLNQQQQQVAPIPQQHAQNNLLSPLELVMNGQPHSLQSPQPQLLPASTHFSPIPGKTAPAILEQLLAMSNFATHQQSQIPNQSHPCTPISAPPTLMPVQPLSTSNSAFVDGGLNLLSQLASHALATASPAQHPHNNNPLAVAAATELQRLQLLQLCAQQQQLQLQQQLALLEQSQREQQQQQQHSFQLTGGHSAPLSPAHEQLQPSSSIIGDNQSGALLTQLLLSRLINASTETGNIQQLHQPQQQQQPNSPPLSMSASQAVVNFPAISLFAHRQQQSELQQAVLLLQQQQQQTILLEQHQQVEVAQLLTSQLAVAAATQQQHQDSTPSSSEPELAVV